MHYPAKFFLILWLIFILIGCALLLFPKFSFFGLPGDIIFKRDNVVFILPIATGILLSIIITIILNILLRK
ncbi:MAG: DUF2905 domain-containing protein [candidate division WOR-3 bacterium]|nr:MAG: DUF2905 domain-containing protein [candidate division WOR-3 bacterium]